MIYELRIYRALPGCFDRMVERFATIFLPIWKRFGIHHVGFWTTTNNGRQELYYILAWESQEDWDRKWAAFMADEERKTKFAESEKGGSLVDSVSTLVLEPTFYSRTIPLQLGLPEDL
jgi:hypothetical protein